MTMKILCRVCRKDAFLWVGPPPIVGDTIRSESARHLDGSPVYDYTVIQCPHGHPFLPRPSDVVTCA
jgi:hypothetical protein